MPDRVIENVVLAETGEVLKVKEMFKSQKLAYEWRQLYQEGHSKFHCIRCGGELSISSNKTDSGFRTFYFFHKEVIDECILSGKVSNTKIKEINRVFAFRESERHKNLKRKLSERLINVEGVDKSSVKEENWIVINGKLVRRPDVSCIYLNKKLVFEIQLSILPLKYMLQRHNFYKEQGMYLIWLLEEFDPRSKSIFIIDVQYLHRHQNFFRLNETKAELHFKCWFKKPYLDKSNGAEVHSPWNEKSVPFHELKFDDSEFQMYYYNLIDELEIKENERKEYLLTLKKEKEVKKRREKEIKEANKKRLINERVNNILEPIRALYNKNWPSIYKDLKETVSKVDYNIMEEVSRQLKLDKLEESSGRPFLIRKLSEGNLNEHNYFLKLIFETFQFQFNIQMKDAGGETLLTSLLRFQIDEFRFQLIKYLFKRGYEYSNLDEIRLKELLSSTGLDLEQRRRLLLIYHYFSTYCYDVDTLDEKHKLFFGLMSLKKKELYGFSQSQGIYWLINYLIDNFSQDGDVLLKAIEVYCNPIELALKPSVLNKLSKLQANKEFNSQHYSWQRILRKNFPELGIKEDYSSGLPF